jgi:two-component system, response regulator, stage 0 sporulation protein A
MSKQISVLIADDNVEFGDILIEYLKMYENITVVGVARDGIKTVDMIRELLPDVVILDVIMPGLDGIGVLERVSDMYLKHRPSFLVLTAVGQDIFVQKAMALGAEYYMLKPFDIDILVPRIIQVYSENNYTPLSHGKDNSKTSEKIGSQVKKNDSPVMLATELIQRAGIMPHISGYPYLRDAVVMSMDHSGIFNSIMKALYPQIAAKYNTTPHRIERAIRSAIYNAWDKGLNSNNENVNEIFNSMGKVKPTNGRFINMLANMIRQEIDIQRSIGQH